MLCSNNTFTTWLSDQLLILIITITISSNVIGASAALYFTNHCIQLYQAPVIGQLKRPIKSTQPNPPITKLITITIATTTYPGKKM